MSSHLSLMVTPTKLDNNDEGPPQFYVLRDDVWREVPLAGAIGTPSQVRASVDAKLTMIMNNPANSRFALVTAFRDFWSKWVPESVQREIRDLVGAEDDPPCLLIYVHAALEWIPWELMHDGSDFLGVRYVIARLPIVRRGPLSIPETRVVTRVSTFLGQHLDDLPQADWEAIFQGLSNGVTIDRFPTNGVWPTADDVARQGSTDILDITCHGGTSTSEDTFEAVWTLNHEDLALVSGISRAGVEQMKFGEQGGPLVFGNACQGAAGAATPQGLVPGLAYSFFDNGAAAFIGAFAPIRAPIAVKFAATFYRHLLIDGLSVGKALWRTKADFNAEGEQDPTWLFYCLYGPPSTQFAVA